MLNLALTETFLYKLQGQLIKSKADPSDPDSLPELHPQAAADLGGKMEETFNNTGLVYARNTGLTDLKELRQVGRLVMKNEQVRRRNAKQL